jgi:hypothetical protein
MIGCLGYLIDSVIFFLLPNVDAAVSHVTGLGEILLALWLLIKGVNVEQWQNALLKLPENSHEQYSFSASLVAAGHSEPSARPFTSVRSTPSQRDLRFQRLKDLRQPGIWI